MDNLTWFNRGDRRPLAVQLQAHNARRNVRRPVSANTAEATQETEAREAELARIERDLQRLDPALQRRVRKFMRKHT